MHRYTSEIFALSTLYSLEEKNIRISNLYNCLFKKCFVLYYFPYSSVHILRLPLFFKQLKRINVKGSFQFIEQFSYVVFFYINALFVIIKISMK